MRHRKPLLFTLTNENQGKMKYSAIGLILLLMIACSPNYQVTSGTNQPITVNYPDSTVVIRVSDASPRVKEDLIYYWFKNGEVGMTQGFYAGHVLDGVFESYVESRLVATGQFQDGLRSGVWHSYLADTMVTTTYKNGVVKPQNEKRSLVPHQKDTTSGKWKFWKSWFPSDSTRTR